MTHPDSFGARSTLEVGGTSHEVFRLDALQSRYDVARLPYTLRVLLENVVRREDGELEKGGYMSYEKPAVESREPVQGELWWKGDNPGGGMS